MSSNGEVSKSTLKRRRARLKTPLTQNVVISSSSEETSSDSYESESCNSSSSSVIPRKKQQGIPTVSSESSSPNTSPERAVGELSGSDIEDNVSHDSDISATGANDFHGDIFDECLSPAPAYGSDIENGVFNQNMEGEREGENRKSSEPANVGHESDNSSEYSVSNESGILNSEESGDESSDQSDSGLSTIDNSESSDETDFESEVEDDPAPEPGNEPLYPGAPLSVAQSLIAVMTLALTHALTGQCIVDILTLISLHCVSKDKCIASLYKFKKFFQSIGQSVLKFHHYCVSCSIILESKETVCGSCNGEGEKSYFIELPLLCQLQTMLSRPGFYEQLQFRFIRKKKVDSNIEDIYDGRIYSQHFKDNGFLRNPNALSFSWYADGMAVFKSSKFSLWGLYFVINELRYKERVKRENIILAGVWFGPKKPDPNLFLTPFQDSICKFGDEGFDFDVHGQGKIRFKALLLCGTCDMQAKGLFMRLKMYNGYFGCPRCKSRGTRYPVGRSSVHVHEYNANTPLRTNNEVLNFARLARVQRRSVYGVKGLSRLYLMMPDMIKGIAIDVMHGVFLGVSKLLVNLWFNPSLSGQPFSLSNVVDIVDDLLKKIKPPSYVQRLPRSIKNHRALWKAQEYKVWLLYYSIPVLSSVMKPEYLDHHMKLVSAIYLLSKQSISLEQIQAASDLLHSYVSNFSRLYGLRFLGINVHQLLHLPDIVLDLGPLWAHSCFYLEDLNGKLVSLIHGTQYVSLQVASGAYTFMNLPVLINKLPPLSDVRKYCEKLTACGKQHKLAEIISPKLSVIGTYKVNVSDASKALIQAKYGIVGGHFQEFYRLRKNGVLFFSNAYHQTIKKLSNFVSCTVNNRSVLCRIEHFIRWSPCECNNICMCRDGRKLCCVGLEYRRQMWHAQEIPDVRLSYLCKVIQTDSLIVFDVEEIEHLCFFMEIDGDQYIAEPINDLEVE